MSFAPILYTISSKLNAPWLRYFRPRVYAVGFVALFEVNKCEGRDCTLQTTRGALPGCTKQCFAPKANWTDNFVAFDVTPSTITQADSLRT